MLPPGAALGARWLEANVAGGTRSIPAPVWRAELLERVLKVAFGLGVAIGIASSAYALASGQLWIVMLDLVVLGLLAAVTFHHGLPYRFRAAVMALLTYAVGVSLLSTVGPVALIYLLGFPVIAAVFLGLTAAVAALAVNTGTLVVAGLSDTMAVELPATGVDSTVEWLLVVANFLFVNTMLAVISAVLLARLERALGEERRAAADLDDERRRLAAANRELAEEITERRRTEADLQLLATAVGQARDIVLIADRHGRVTYDNHVPEALARRLGLDETGTHLADLRVDATTRRVLEGTVTRGEDWAGELRLIDDPPVEFDTVLSPVRRGGRVTAFVAVLRDVTEERRLGRRLRQAEQLEALGALATGTAHDFNNVLGSILAVAEHTRAAHGPGPVGTSMDTIIDACGRARDVIRKMMTFARRTDLGRTTVDLQAAIQGAIPLLRAGLDPGITIRTDLQPGLQVACRPGDLDQILTNLASNAAHAMRDRLERVLHISVQRRAAGTDPCAEPPGDAAVITVTDTGAGIAAEALPHLFEPFYTTKESGEGTGLGLASVDAIVRALDGTVTVASTPGTGTSFRIALPLVGAPTPADAEAAEDAEPVTGGAGTRVLLVDDEDTIRHLTGQGLEQLGYAVTTAADGEEARAHLTRPDARFDVLITDLRMPRLDGQALARLARAHRPQMRVVLCSGFGDDETVAAGPADAGWTFLAKPFTLRELRQLLPDPGWQADAADAGGASPGHRPGH